MRFFLLARARSSGLIRLLSERAYDSRSAAIEAASATASADAIDLGDDEVLAVDLDAAGPVLVLRIQAPLTTTTAVFGPPAEPPAAVVAAAGIFAPDVPMPSSFAPSPFADEAPGLVDAEPEPAVRLQPRFPLFGADDDAPEDGLAETLRRVARRMQEDLMSSGHTEWAAADDSWDARTLDDYALPDDAHMSGAREEGRLRVDAAERLRTDEAAVSREADDRNDRYDTGAGSSDRLLSEADFRYDESFTATGHDEAGKYDPGYGAAAETWDDADEVAADDRTLDVLPEYPVEVFGSDALVEPTDAKTLREDDVDVSDASLVGSEADPFMLEPTPESETAPLDEEPERDAVASEPAPYRPAILDFAMWVCADCVYQRTCRRAGVASPATCGNFQWRSF